MKRMIVLFGLLLVATAAWADEPHPFSVHDMLAMDRISDPQVSPDGDWVAFNVRSTDLEANRGRTDLWIARTDGSEVKRLTTDEAGDWNPRWCLNGTSLLPEHAQRQHADLEHRPRPAARPCRSPTWRWASATWRSCPSCAAS